MTAQQYLDTYRGQSLLYAPSPAREWLRGQCVQSVCFYVTANGAPVLWADAKDWWVLAASHPEYERIVNTPDAVPQPGDIIIWNGNLPGSGGSGHVDVCLQAYPGTGTFAGVDQNWGGKTVHQVTHNYNYVIGWLRIKGVQAGGMGGGEVAAAPAPAPAVTQGDEMIADTNQAHEAYQLLRPNGDGSPDEIAGTAGKRSWAQFANDAKGEVAARNQNLRDQQQHMADMQGVINSTNATITDLRATINNDQVTNTQKQMALDTALAQIAKDNAEMTTLHDQVTDLQAKIADPLASASAALSDVAGIAKDKAGKSGGFIVAFFKFFMQLNLSKIFPKLRK